MIKDPNLAASARERTRTGSLDSQKMDLPGPLRLLTNQKPLFIVPPRVGRRHRAQPVLWHHRYRQRLQHQRRAPGLRGAGRGARPVRNARRRSFARDYAEPVKHFTIAPAMVIDPAKQYTATLHTTKGDIVIDLFPTAAPQSVNSFVYLATQNYYDNTAFLEVAKRTRTARPSRRRAATPRAPASARPATPRPKRPRTSPSTRAQWVWTAASSSFPRVITPRSTASTRSSARWYLGLDVLQKLSLLDVSKGPSSAPANATPDVVQSVSIVQDPPA